MVSKSQLAQRIAARGASPSQARYAVDAVLDEITAALAVGERVTLVGFGSFEPVVRAARIARNPRTGQSVPVAAATVARFRPGASLKAAVDGGTVTLGDVGALPGRPAPVVAAATPRPGGKGAKPAGSAKDTAKKGSSKKDAKGKGKPDKGKRAAKKHKG